jgi:predicted RNA methylase
MHINVLKKIFPYLNEKRKMHELKIDDESLYSISTISDANKISSIILDNLKKINLNPCQIIITDATAGVGGNTLSFAGIFKSVNCIEIDKNRSVYLKNNLNIYNIKNCVIYNDDCTKILDKLDNSVIFFDPPWGGREYKKHKNIRLTLSGTDIEQICNKLLNDKNIKNLVMIVLKLPLNYDIQHIYDSINENITVCVIRRMQIVIIIKKDYLCL